jgi:hypothetical protein
MAHPQIIMKDQEVTPVFQESTIIDPYEMRTVAIENVGDKTIYRYAQTVGGILNDNEQQRNECVNEGSKEFRKTASIPFVVWNLWENMGITKDQKELRKAIQRHKNEYMTVNKQII